MPGPESSDATPRPDPPAGGVPPWVYIAVGAVLLTAALVGGLVYFLMMADGHRAASHPW